MILRCREFRLETHRDSRLTQRNAVCQVNRIVGFCWFANFAGGFGTMIIQRDTSGISIGALTADSTKPTKKACISENFKKAFCRRESLLESTFKCYIALFHVSSRFTMLNCTWDILLSSPKSNTPSGYGLCVGLIVCSCLSGFQTGCASDHFNKVTL